MGRDTSPMWSSCVNRSLNFKYSVPSCTLGFENQNLEQDLELRIVLSYLVGLLRVFIKIYHSLLRYLMSTPQVGFEPTTNRLTADRSTPELLRILPI